MDPLIEYIDFCKKQGYSDELIMKKLITSGYTGDKIEMAFMAFRQDEDHQEAHDTYISRIKFLSIVIIILLVLSAIAGYFFFTI